MRHTLALFAVAVAWAPATAQARSYDVWSCNLPDGRDVGIEGWTAERRGSASGASNRCTDVVLGRDGGLNASLPGTVPRGDFAGWTFSAPTDTTIAGYTLWRAVRSSASAHAFKDYFFTHDVPRTLDSRYFAEFCSHYASCAGRGDGARPFAAANRFERSNLQLRRLHAFMVCDALPEATHCAGDGGWFTIFSARVALEDPYGPEFIRRPYGSLFAGNAPLEGERTVSFAARDRGGGAREGRHRRRRRGSADGPR